ncbi:hypothetical protein GCM10028807_25370 [Spirosoma daeguense]
MVFGQDSTKTNRSELLANKWEIGIDLLSLIDKSKDAFGFVVKRNFNANNGRKAIRFKVLPRTLYSPGATLNENNSSFFVAMGYERQKLVGRFSVLYGIEPFFQYSIVKIKQVSNGALTLQQTDTKVGLDGFIGGRYYINNHLSATIETHLVYQYRSTEGESGTVRYSGDYNQVFINPIHALYLSYHF